MSVNAGRESPFEVVSRIDASDYPDTWRKESRGGYGYVLSVPCRFLARTDKRIKVMALHKDGTGRVRYIAPESFKPGKASA